MDIRLTVAEWAKVKRTPLVWVKAAAISEKWKDLYILLSEEDYDDAIECVQNVECH